MSAIVTQKVETADVAQRDSALPAAGYTPLAVEESKEAIEDVFLAPTDDGHTTDVSYEHDVADGAHSSDSSIPPDESSKKLPGRIVRFVKCVQFTALFCPSAVVAVASAIGSQSACMIAEGIAIGGIAGLGVNTTIRKDIRDVRSMRMR